MTDMQTTEPTPYAPLIESEYSYPDAPLYEITCDPPYEDMDGGTDATCVTVPASDVRHAVMTMVRDVLPRLDAGQVPATLDIRRVS